MLELFVGDVVYYVTPEQTLAKDKIKAVFLTRQKGKSKPMYLLYNGLSKPESELFLSLKRAKVHFEHCKIEVKIPKSLDME